MRDGRGYRITVEGHLESHWARWFDGVALSRDPRGRTVLSGSAIDQSALYGILLQLRDLGLTLVSVSREPAVPAPGGAFGDRERKRERKRDRRSDR